MTTYDPATGKLEYGPALGVSQRPGWTPGGNLVTDRPWNGLCATTGHTVEQFAAWLGRTDQNGQPWDSRVTRAAVRICRSYGIKGQADPAYIANVITNELAGQ